MTRATLALLLAACGQAPEPLEQALTARASNCYGCVPPPINICAWLVPTTWQVQVYGAASFARTLGQRWLAGIESRTYYDAGYYTVQSVPVHPYAYLPDGTCTEYERMCFATINYASGVPVQSVPVRLLAETAAGYVGPATSSGSDGPASCFDPRTVW